MKRSQILKAVETAIATREPSSSDKWFLCWKGGKIIARPTYLVRNPEIILDAFTENEATNGFNSIEWNGICARIVTFLEQRGLL